MSRRFGKRKEENEYASEGDNPLKKSCRTDDSDDEDGIVVCEVSFFRFLRALFLILKITFLLFSDFCGVIFLSDF